MFYDTSIKLLNTFPFFICGVQTWFLTEGFYQTIETIEHPVAMVSREHNRMNCTCTIDPFAFSNLHLWVLFPVWIDISCLSRLFNHRWFLAAILFFFNTLQLCNYNVLFTLSFQRIHLQHPPSNANLVLFLYKVSLKTSNETHMTKFCFDNLLTIDENDFCNIKKMSWGWIFKKQLWKQTYTVYK